MAVEIPSLNFIVGLQGGGKSHLIKYIMYRNRNQFDFGIVFSNTGFASGNFNYLNKRFVHLQYDEAVLANFKKLIEEQIKKGKKPCTFVVFDDCLDRKNWYSQELISLATQVRHYNTLVIISTQYPQQIMPIFRENSFHTYMFHMNSKCAIRALFDSFGQMFDSYDDFKTYFLKATGERHQFLAYNARNGGTTIDDRYEVLVAPEKIPDFHIKFKPRS